MIIGSAPLSEINKRYTARDGSVNDLSQSTGNELSQQFLRLLIEQMKNQDPLNPTSNAELTSQLAQISTVSGIQDLNANLSVVTGQIDSTQRLQASALIGHGILIKGDKILLTKDKDDKIVSSTFGFNLAGPADDVSITVTDDSGSLIRTFKLGAVDAGVQSFNWDGSTDAGGTADVGTYHAKITATQKGQGVTVDPLTLAFVIGVIYNKGMPIKLDLGASGEVGMDGVYQVL